MPRISYIIITYASFLSSLFFLLCFALRFFGQNTTLHARLVPLRCWHHQSSGLLRPTASFLFPSKDRAGKTERRRKKKRIITVPALVTYAKRIQTALPPAPIRIGKKVVCVRLFLRMLVSCHISPNLHIQRMRCNEKKESGWIFIQIPSIYFPITFFLNIII